MGVMGGGAGRGPVVRGRIEMFKSKVRKEKEKEK